MNLGATTEETLQMFRKGGASGRLQGEALAALLRAEGISTSNELTAYDLQPVVKWQIDEQLVLLNSTPAYGGGTGDSTHWKAISKVNASRNASGVSEGQRNAFDSYETKKYLATYKTIGRETFVTKEAEEAAQGFDDANAIAAFGLMMVMRREQERVMLGSNNSLALGQAVLDTLTDVTGEGGVIPDGTTVKVYVVAMTNQGWITAGFKGLAAAGDSILCRVTRANADGTSDTYGGYVGKLSAVGTITVGSPGTDDHSVGASCADIKGAVAYAWFWGPTTGAGSKLGAVTSINSIRIPSEVGLSAATNSTTTGIVGDASQTDLGTDYSKNALEPDGLLSLLMGAGQVDSSPAATDSGAFYASAATGTQGVGTSLTFDGAAGCIELDAMIAGIYSTNKTRMAPKKILLSTQLVQDIAKGIIAGGGAPLFRFNVDVQSAGASAQQAAAQAMLHGRIAAGATVVSYLSKLGYGGPQGIPLIHHPDLADGTMVAMSEDLPYPGADMPAAFYRKYRSAYYQIAWPLRTRRRETGVYSSEVYALAFGPAFGVYKNLAPVS